MADLRFVAVQTRYQLIALTRNRRAVILGLVLPVVLLLMFNSVFVPDNEDTTHLAGATIGAHAYFTAAMLAYAILGTAFNQLGIGLVSQRESGQLKRLRGTPVPAWTFVAVLLAFTSGIFVPVDQLPGWLADIGRFFPVYDVAAGLQTALGVAGDTALKSGNLLALAAWGVAGVVVAARHFRWEPAA
jgi:ABC-2 type transport system permease protein